MPTGEYVPFPEGLDPAHIIRKPQPWGACPRCGSTDRGERLSVPVPVDVPGLHTRCPDSWHRVPSTEPKEG